MMLNLYWWQVVDTGLGIEEERLENLFDPYRLIPLMIRNVVD